MMMAFMVEFISLMCRSCIHYKLLSQQACAFNQKIINIHLRSSMKVE